MKALAVNTRHLSFHSVIDSYQTHDGSLLDIKEFSTPSRLIKSGYKLIGPPMIISEYDKGMPYFIWWFTKED